MPRKKKDKVIAPKDDGPVLNILDVGVGFSEPAPEPEPLSGIEPPIGISPDPSLNEPKTFDGDKPKRPPRKPKKHDEDGNPLIDGEMLLLLIDVIVPMVIATGHNMLAKGDNISPDNLMLTEKQKESMKRFADKAAERIDINAHPVAVLLLGLGGIYTVNYLNEKGKKK